MTEAKQDTKQTTKPEERFKTVTMGDLRGQLPIGSITPDGKLVKTVSSIPFKMKQEKELANRKKTAVTGADFANATLSLLLEQFGLFHFPNMKEIEKTIALQQAYFPDILYAYLWIRREALGSNFPMMFECGRCKEPNHFPADLDTLEVRVVEDAKKLRWDLELRDGVVVLGKLRKKFTLQPPVWGSINATRDEDSYQLLETFRACLVGVEGIDSPPVLLDSDADEISRWDSALIEASITENVPGPKMLIEHRCKKCRTPFIQQINWISDSFFTIASPSMMKGS